MTSYYEALSICKAAMDVAVRVDAVDYYFECPMALEPEQEEFQ